MGVGAVVGGRYLWVWTVAVYDEKVCGVWEGHRIEATRLTYTVLQLYVNRKKMYITAVNEALSVCGVQAVAPSLLPSSLPPSVDVWNPPYSRILRVALYV